MMTKREIQTVKTVRENEYHEHNVDHTENEENVNIYSVDENGDPGNKICYLKHGEPFFY
jgi:hypothetical protein